MIITKELIIKTTNKNIKHYKQFFKDIKSGDKIEICTYHLPKGSKEKIDVSCDNCGNIKQYNYKDYLYVIKKSNIYYCNKCKKIKTKKTNLKKYGVENVFQLESVKIKSKNTCQKKYGVEFYQKTQDYKKKIKNTNIRKYDFEYPMQNENIKNKSKINSSFNSESIQKMILSKKNKYKKKFISKATQIHKNKYDYSLINYIRCTKKVKIICKKHGIFKQRPQDHIHNKHGCPICRESKGENKIRDFLKLNKIMYITQKKFKECMYKKILLFDFYLPEHNLCIEYDGEQHFKSIKYFGGEEAFLKRQIRDKIKTNYCNENNIELLRIKYDENIEKRLNNLII